jgi:hypothetical protein
MKTENSRKKEFAVYLFIHLLIAPRTSHMLAKLYRLSDTPTLFICNFVSEQSFTNFTWAVLKLSPLLPLPS